MSLYAIKPASLRDAKAIAELHVAAWQHAYADLLAPEDLATLSVDKRLAMWREAIEYGEPQVLVAVQGETVVGFVGFDRSRDPKTPNTMGEIWALYVEPDHWGEGLGLALWDAAREGLMFEGCTKVSAWVPLGCERAMRFFDMAGFKREMTTIKTVPMGNTRVEEIRFKRDLN